MKIRLATDDDRQAWDTYVLKHPDGLAYHQFAWQAAISDAYTFDRVYLVADRGSEFCGVLPLINFQQPFLKHSFVSLPYCDVGGVLADGPEIERSLVAEAKKLVVASRAKKLELRQRLSGNLVKDSESSPAKVRMILPLATSADELLAGMKAKLRSQVLKPGRDGLTACVGGAELTDTFYQVFTQNMRDIGSPVHSLKWFQSIMNHYQHRARIGVVYMPDGSIAAAGLILLHDRIVSIPWASSLRCYNRFNPNMLLYWTFLSFAADSGFQSFDFGRSTPGTGTYKFKAQWGAEPEALNWVQFDQNGDKIPILTSTSTSTVRTQAEACWQRLPLPISNFIGPWLRRYISL